MTGPSSPASPSTAVGMPAAFSVMRKPCVSSIDLCSATDLNSPYSVSGVSNTRSERPMNASLCWSIRSQITSLFCTRAPLQHQTENPCRSTVMLRNQGGAFQLKSAGRGAASQRRLRCCFGGGSTLRNWLALAVSCLSGR